MSYRIILLSLIISFSAVSFAQGTTERVKKRATTRAEQRANNRLDQKVDEGVDKAFNAIEGLFKKKNKKNDSAEPAPDTPETDSPEATEAEASAAASILDAMTGGRQDWEPFQNDHPFSLTMTMTETKKNGKSTTTVMHVGATRDELAIVGNNEGDDAYQMILNTESGKTTMITTDKKGNREGYRMRMPNFSKIAGEAANEMVDYIEMTQTGEHKTIDGYDCELIIVEDTKHNTTTRSWVTQDLPLTHMDVFGAMTGFAGAGRMNIPVQTPGGTEAPFEGLLIHSTTVDGKKTFETRITNIKVGEGELDRSLFDTTGANIQELGF